MLRTIIITLLALMIMVIAITTTVSCSIKSPDKEMYKIEYNGRLK